MTTILKDCLIERESPQYSNLDDRLRDYLDTRQFLKWSNVVSVCFQQVFLLISLTILAVD